MSTPPRSQITVSVWIDAERPSAEGMESAVSQWDVQAGGDVAGFDAGSIGGLTTQGYFGAVFDGRRILFAPMQTAADKYHANVLAFDTWGKFESEASYEACDASATAGLDTRGFYGAAFDGRHVHFVPRKTEKARHSNMLRWNSQKTLADRSAWSASDAGLTNCRQGVAYDGRYLYFAPGYDDENPHQEQVPSSIVLRRDTHKDEGDPAAFSTFDLTAVHPQAASFDGACFDGRYIYFAPLTNPVVVRYDTQGEFQDAGAWQAFDAASLGMAICVGAIYDGTYIYFVPYGHGRVVRCNSRGAFTSPESWECFDAEAFRPCGYDGAFFDGRFITFIPFVEIFPDSQYQLHSRFLSYDTLQDFQDDGAWQAHDRGRVGGLAMHGYNGGAFDGRYFYCAPWRDKICAADGHIAHGRILRLDTAAPGSAFNLQWSTLGHNGGLCAAVPGPTFVLQTESGLRSVQAHRIFAAGRRHLAATYDGKFARLFVDGREVAAQPAEGRIVDSRLPISPGQLAGGGGRLRGRVLEWEVLPHALPADEILRRASTSRGEHAGIPQLVA